jgi:hypothetical protein
MVHAGGTVGWLLLGERRNLYPYFNGERHHLLVVAELLGAAIANLRGRVKQEEIVVDARTAPEAPEGPVLGSGLGRDGHEGLDADWIAEVLEVGHDAADRNPSVAVEVIRRLHRMQAHLEEESELVAMSEELDFARDYLALERLRLRNRLEVDRGVDRAAENARVPRGVLHPLLENAFDHGVGKQLRVGRVEVHVRVEDGEIALEVFDNGGGFPIGFDPERLPEGGGLQRLRKRLSALDARLMIDTASADGGAVSVRLLAR